MLQVRENYEIKNLRTKIRQELKDKYKARRIRCELENISFEEMLFLVKRITG